VVSDPTREEIGDLLRRLVDTAVEMKNRAERAEAQLAKAREDALREASHLMPRYFGIWSATGVHIGVWEDGAIAAKVLADVYGGGVMRDLIDVQDILALIDTPTPTPAPSPDDVVRAAREDIARAIFVSSIQSHMSPKDWDSGAIIGPENSHREKIYKIADAVIAAIIERAGK
jgi:hypothetical protein